jgi:hypothetical protein
MKLLRDFSGSKPQRGEDRIGGSLLGLPPDPVLDPREALGGLVDVVAVGDVDNGLEQLLEALGATKGRAGRFAARAAARRVYRGPHAIDLSHPSAFSRGFEAVTQTRPVAA